VDACVYSSPLMIWAWLVPPADCPCAVLPCPLQLLSIYYQSTRDDDEESEGGGSGCSVCLHRLGVFTRTVTLQEFNPL
jgi:hypothetical protein